MKRIYLSILSIAIAVGANAQQNKVLTSKHSGNFGDGIKHEAPVLNLEKAAVLWSDDFSTPANWTMTNTSAPISWDWVITTDPNAVPSAGNDPSLQPFNSTTAANGYAIINSDGQPGNVDGDGAIVAEITNATPIDLSATPNVVLKFQHSYRWWQDDRGVRVSGDNGSTWTDYPITSLVGGAIANGYPNLQNSENPVTEVINISAVAGNMSQVLIQFYYNDNDVWAWYWTVDDVEVLEQPADDIQLLSAWISGTNNEGVEYGRTPIDQVDADYFVGGQIYNFGVNDATNVSITADFTGAGVFSSNGTDANPLVYDSTVIIEQTETPTYVLGVYNGTYTAVSDLETGGAEFGNNVYQRSFEITNDVYSQDGMGIHPVETLSSLGTASFAGGEDGLIVAAMYHIKASEDVVGIKVMLGAGTVEGAEAYGSIMDTADFIAGNMNPLYSSAAGTISATDIANGYIVLPFTGVVLAPGAYYAAVELYSFANNNDITIVDDVTVPQPAWASAIYIPGDQSYTNGEALGIRLLVNTLGIGENTLEGVSVYPNPSEGIVNVSNTNGTENTITVTDMTGKVISTTVASEATELDLSAQGAGVYMVKVSNENGSIVEKVIIK